MQPAWEQPVIKRIIPNIIHGRIKSIICFNWTKTKIKDLIIKFRNSYIEEREELTIESEYKIIIEVKINER